MAAPAEKWAAEATSHAEAGHFGRAAELFAKAAQQAPGNAKHHEARAQCLLELEEFDNAVSSAEAAVKLEEDWLPGRATFGRALFNAGRLEDAVTELERALRLAHATSNSDWVPELAGELAEAQGLLSRHWQEHHDLLLPLSKKGEALRVRQALDCRYCRLSNAELGPGGAVWAAGCILAKNNDLIASTAGKEKPRVLELGSGTGAGGLAAAATGAEVILTDHSCLLSLLQLNTSLNAPQIEAAQGSVASCGFDWEAPPPEELKAKPFDLAIGADLVYSFAAVGPFATALSAVLLPRGGAPPLAPAMLYAHFPRFPGLDAELTKALAARGLETQERPLPGVSGAVGSIPEEALSRVRLLEIRPAAAAAPMAGGYGGLKVLEGS